MSARIAGAVKAVHNAIAVAADIPADSFGVDDDIVSVVRLNWVERESLALIVEEIFNITLPDDLFATPHHRTATALADWVLARAEQAAWITVQQKRVC